LRLVRKLTAPLSVIFLIAIAGLALTHLQAGSEPPPAILDPTFDLWGTDPDSGQRRPLVWEVEYVQGKKDQILLDQASMHGKKALVISVFQDGSDEKWTYVKLTQTLEGARLKPLFNDEVGIWIYLESICAPCLIQSGRQPAFFAIETNDGMHTIDFTFSNQTAETQQFLSHRTVFLDTPRGEWVFHRITVADEYRTAGWNAPDRISLSIVLGAPGSASGWNLAYVHGFTVASSSTALGAQQEHRERVFHSPILETGEKNISLYHVDTTSAVLGNPVEGRASDLSVVVRV